MRAIVQEELGGPETLKEICVPRPTSGVGEVLVAVHAASLNPTDWKNRSQVLTIDRLPLILGWDVSGVIEDVGLGVTLFKPGDEVFGMLPYPNGVGAHAEYVVGPARSFTHKPAALDHVQAGALPLAALTAHQALLETANIQPGQRILIHAAAGGVGHLAVQMAKNRGGYVIGTSRAEKHDFLRSLGVDEVIDYRTTDFGDVVSNVDVVLDTIGSNTTLRSVDVLRTGGILISIVGLTRAAAAKAAARGVRAEFLIVEADHAGMKTIAEQAASGALVVHVEAVFPLTDAAEAHTMSESGRTKGKIVLTV